MPGPVCILRVGVTLLATIAARTTNPSPTFLVMRGLVLGPFTWFASGGDFRRNCRPVQCNHDPVPLIKTRDGSFPSGGQSTRALPAPINTWRIWS